MQSPPINKPINQPTNMSDDIRKLSSSHMLWVYFRNNLTILGLQAFLVKFALNASLVTRLGIQPFTYVEVLLYCFILLVLAHSIKLFIMIDYFSSISNILEQLRKQVAEISSINYNVGITSLSKLIDIDEKLEKILKEPDTCNSDDEIKNKSH